MKKVLDFIDRIVIRYKYKQLPAKVKRLAHRLYSDNIPTLDSSRPIYSKDGLLISKRFDRIVIGDYGAYIEFSVKDAEAKNMICEEDQEYRMRLPWRANVKYLWYTTKDKSHCKIYYQKKTVQYADYKVGKCYISPYEITQKEA